jgi:hypothetical protein
MIKITGYVREVGDFGVLGKPGRGALIECTDRDVMIGGLTKNECKALGAILMELVEIEIRPAEGATEGRK